MGICSSCLGLGRRRSKAEDPETSRLLSDDPYRPNYGIRAHARRTADGPDPERARREREILNGIAHGMSEEVVDIFTMLPEASDDANDDRSISPPPQTNGFKEDDARAQEMAYQTVKRTHLAKVSNPVGDYKDGWQGAKPATT